VHACRHEAKELVLAQLAVGIGVELRSELDDLIVGHVQVEILLYHRAQLCNIHAVRVVQIVAGEEKLEEALRARAQRLANNLRSLQVARHLLRKLRARVVAIPPHR